MADAFETFTKFIQSPPGHFAVGAALGGIVWKFFERVEAVLNENTKREIADWLVGVDVSRRMAFWPGTFATVLDRFFGDKPISWRCFTRSCLVTYVAGILLVPVAVVFLDAQGLAKSLGLPFQTHYTPYQWLQMLCFSLLGISFVAVAPDYLSVVKTRMLLVAMSKSTNVVRHIFLLGSDLLLSFLLSGLVMGTLSIIWVWLCIVAFHHLFDAQLKVPAFTRFVVTTEIAGWTHPTLALGTNFVPTFFTSIWLWLYAGSGFLLKAARRFDIGFQWFNRHADIEKKPLQSIGLVAGCIVAVMYWIVALLHRLI